MKMYHSKLLLFLFLTAFGITKLFAGADSQVIIDLRDFRDEEVKSAGITISQSTTVHINALGGKGKRGWNIGWDSEEPQMYAGGWIIDANTRNVVWEMTIDNTSGKEEKRKFDGDVTLKPGSYEVYYAAYGFVRSGWLGHMSINIDRRRNDEEGKKHGESIFNFFDEDDMYGEFMELAKNWGITLTLNNGNSSDVQHFDAPLKNKNEILAIQKAGDDLFAKKFFSLDKDMPLHVYALGEGRRRDGMFDYGWLINTQTRERVWEMTVKNTEHCGGDPKNIKYDEDVNLTKGTYELFYSTDESNSNDDWNAKPPYDPYNYGITLSVKNDGDKNAFKVLDTQEDEKNIIAQLTKVGDDDYVNTGFTLSKETKVRIYAIGERNGDQDLADYGWLINGKTHEHIWDMNDEQTEHAGGAQKNRMVDEVITLPKGSYEVYYQTDGSHSYKDWNSSAPYDQEHYGITIYGVGENFDEKSISKYNGENDDDVIVQIVKVRDDKDLTKTFSITQPTTVRIYAIGEGKDHQMYDYGWIENKETEKTIWEMTYKMTERAGGASKNRKVDTTIQLEPGEYELHFVSDGSHSYNDWNDDAPEDRTHWGITVYKVQQ